MKCPTPQELSEFARGLIATDRDAEIEQHVDICEACQSRLLEKDIPHETQAGRLRWSCVVEPGVDELNQRVDRILERIRRSVSTDSKHGSPTELTAGQELSLTGHVRVGEELSEGGLGKIWKSTDEFDRPVALKVILGSRAADEEVRQRFLAEARLTARLAHPGIVTVYSAGRTDDGLPFYSMYLVDGITLEKAIKMPKNWSRNELLRRFLDVCDAMDYAHNRGVLHRDIKPANILLGTYGETIVIDWGLARDNLAGSPEEVDKEHLDISEVNDAKPWISQPGSLVGTPAYMSPEQASGKELGPASDIYSLGATLFTILTGKAPFRGKKSDEIMERVTRGDFSKPRSVRHEVPRALEAICLHAMALAPEARYSSVKLLRNDIQAWLDDVPTSIYRDPLVVRVARWARRHRTFTAVLVTAAVLGTTAVSIDRARYQASSRSLAAKNNELRQRFRELAESHQLAAGQFYRQGQMLDSLREFSAARQLRARQYSDEPNDENRFQLARAWNGVALTLHKSGQVPAAAENYEKALEHARAILKRKPNNAEYLKLLIMILGNRGMTDLAYGNPEVATATYEEALAAHARLKTEVPNAKWLQEEARLNGNLADALHKTPHTDREIMERRNAIATLNELAVLLPDDQTVREFMAVHAVRLATTLRQIGRENEAYETLQNAIELGVNLEAGEPWNWGQQLNAAACLVLLSEREADQYKSTRLAARAVIALENIWSVVDDEWRQEVRQEIETRVEYDALRIRTDFRELVDSLSEPVASPKPSETQ